MKFLFSAWPYAGHVNPCLAVAQALRRRGHEVAFFTGAAAHDAVAGAGFERFPFRTLARRVAEITGSADTSDHASLYAALTERYTTVAETGLRSRWRRVRALYHEMLTGTITAQASDLTELLAEWKPDVLVTDAFLWAPVVILREIQEVPVAVLSFFAGCMVPGRDSPPPGLGLPSPRNWPARLLARLTGSVMRRATQGVRRAMNRVRQQHGLSPVTSTYFKLAGGVPLHLVASSPEYDYQRRDLPASVHYVGACMYDAPSPPSPWQFRLSSGQPVVYVSEGTCQVRRPIVLRAAAEGLGSLPIQVVMTTGKQRDPAALDLGTLSSNTVVESWVSLGQLFPKCSAVVTNGGSGTVRAALLAGVPLVVVPMEWDQLENAQRVVEAGAGLRIAPSRCTAASIRAAVERILHEPRFAQNARRISQSFLRFGQGEEAARLLESLAAGQISLGKQLLTEHA